MIKESKYILRRILIGVGIVLLLSFLNGCKVKALNNEVVEYSNGVSSVSFNIDTDEFPYYILTYNWSNNKYNLYQYTNQPTRYEYYNPPGTPITNYSWSLSQQSARYCVSNYDVATDTYRYQFDCYNTNGFNSLSFNTMENAMTITNGIYGNYKYLLLANFNFDITTGYDIDYFIEHNANQLSSSVPEFVSFNVSKMTEGSLIVGYVFRPEFSVFDSDNYDYLYSYDNENWTKLTENEEVLNILFNTDLYIKIIDKSDDTLIDSATYNINGIGGNNGNNNYMIKIESEYQTNNDSSSSTQLISSYDLYINYFPINSLLRYQYQFVEDGNSLSDNWSSITLTQSNVYKYNTTVNGTLYARILDSEGNVLYSKSYEVNSIGNIVFKNSKNSIVNKFNNLSSSINFARPISSIVKIPLNVINIISTGLAGGLTCNDYNLGSLYNTNIKIPCVNIKQYLGNNLYSLIDMIIACCMIYHVLKMFTDIYNNLFFMQKNPVHDLGKRSD